MIDHATGQLYETTGRGRAFGKSVASFARLCADQADLDFEALQRAVNSGKLAAQTSV